jgi:DNA helicase-2/ATP-dependent DNA helicase PcrA
MHLLDGLNDTQMRAATATRGPVCILAGAGTGKTTTITRRIAYQIASGSHRSDQILAVTFTDRAANEMRSRLSSLGSRAVRAKTFHAEALAQVAAMREGGPPSLLDSKGQILGPLIRRLPAPFKFRATKDVAAEIERAKNRRVPPSRYADDLDGHEPPLPPDLMARVFEEYEQRKRRAGRIDFEDLLEEAIRLLEQPEAAERVRKRYAAFTVDEYQDVNLLQQTLLDRWLQGRDEVCVVGDDHQSIFGFTGATPGYLLSFRERFPHADMVVLEENYRSTGQVLELANRLAGSFGAGARKLATTRPDGPEPKLVEHPTGGDEVIAVRDAVERLIAGGTRPEEIAVLYRVNARSEDFEESFAATAIPFQVRDGAFLRRPGPRAVLIRLQRADASLPCGPVVEAAARDVGWDPHSLPEGVEETTRQADLDRLVRLAEQASGASLGEFLADLSSRFSAQSQGTGVVLSTYHRAKGLEFDAVFLPRLEDRELPFGLSLKTEEDIAEERRLLYVGITRARTHLEISWARNREGKSARPSRFLAELAPRPGGRVAKAPREAPGDVEPDLFARLRAWRARTAMADGLPAYVVFHDATLRSICDRRPATLADLSRIAGIGPTKLTRYGSQVLEVVREASAAAR